MRAIIHRMTVSLLRCSLSTYSLEFAPEDKPIVKAAIEELFGATTITPVGIAANIRLDGENFVYHDEWDHPCLITSSARGKDILELLAAMLGHTSIRSQK